MSGIFIDNSSVNPYFNLALEEFFLKRTDFVDDILILWQNEPTVVIGRHQNTCDEIDEAYVQEMGVHVVRRNSGGGAVYHDMGNLNFSIIQQMTGDYSFFRFVQPVIDCLKAYGIHAEHSSRNDITIDGRKFSGNAQYICNGKILHHGTILFSSDLNVLAKALKPRPDKTHHKGVASVRNRVVNLNDYLTNTTLSDFRQRLIDAIFIENKPDTYIISELDHKAISGIMQTKYLTFKWNYGQSPTGRKAQIKTEAGIVELWLECDSGIVKRARITGDFFTLRPVDDLERQLVGARLIDLVPTVEKLECGSYIQGFANEDMKNLLMQSSCITR